MVHYAHNKTMNEIGVSKQEETWTDFFQECFCSF